MAKGVESQLLQIVRFDQTSANTTLNSSKSSDGGAFTKVLSEQSGASKPLNKGKPESADGGNGLPAQRTSTAAKPSEGTQADPTETPPAQQTSDASGEAASAQASVESTVAAGKPEDTVSNSADLSLGFEIGPDGVAQAVTAGAVGDGTVVDDSRGREVGPKIRAVDPKVAQAPVIGGAGLPTVPVADDVLLTDGEVAPAVAARSTAANISATVAASRNTITDKADRLETTGNTVPAEITVSGAERLNVSSSASAQVADDVLRTLNVTERTEFSKQMAEGLRASVPGLVSGVADELVTSARAVQPSTGELVSPALLSNLSGVSQPTAAATSSITTAPEYALLRSPQDPQFAGELGARVKVLLKEGVKEARLQLHPAELGRLQVTINTDGDQARVVFSADTLAAKEAIEQSIPRLREMLEQNGLQLAHADVDQGGFDQDSQRFGDGGSEGGADPAQEVHSDAAQAEVLLAQSLLDGRVDTYI